MGRDVATLVVRVECQVEAHEVLEAFVLPAGATLAEHGGEVVGPVLSRVCLRGQRASAPVRVLVDLGRDDGQFGEQADCVVKGGFPVVGLVEAALVELGKGGLVA